MVVDPSETAHVAVLEHTVIVLDEASGKYRILSASFFDMERTRQTKRLHVREAAVAQRLIQEGIFTPERIDTMFTRLVVASESRTEHFHSPLWKHRHLRGELSSEKVDWGVATVAFLSILLLKIFGFYALKIAGRSLRRKEKAVHPISPEKIVQKLARIIPIMPFKVECLEWSVSLLCLMRLAGHSVRVVIGVREMPFLAHAWIENLQGHVVGDSSRLRQIYCPILEMASE